MMPSPPLPRVGDVINFIFLFAHETTHRDEGVKERPCMVVEVDPPTNRVLVTPLTTKGDRYANTILVPQEVAKAAGLHFPTSVVSSETNSFTWLGYDVRPVSSTGDIRIGRMTPGFVHSIMQAVYSAKNLRHVDRDTHFVE